MSSGIDGSSARLNGRRERPLLAVFLPVKATQCAGQIRCKRLVKSNANGWSSPCNYASAPRYGARDNYADKARSRAPSKHAVRLGIYVKKPFNVEQLLKTMRAF